MPNNNFSHPNNKKTGIQPVNIVILVIVAIAVIVLGYFALFNKSNNLDNTAIDTVTQNNSMQELNDYFKSEFIQDKNTLDSMIKFVNVYKPKTKTLTSVLGITAEINNFKSLIDGVNFFAQKYSTDTSFINKINKLLNTIKQKQSYYFPIFRQSYCKVADNIMNEDGVNSFISGDNNTTIELVGDRYLEGKNIKIDYDILHSQLELLRYKQIIFKTKSEKTIVKTYNINSINDDTVQ